MNGNRRVLMAVLLGVASAPCFGEPYIGGSVLSSEYEYEDVGHGTGTKFVVGYRAEEAPLMVELAWLDLGEPKIDAASDGMGNEITDGKLGFTGYNASIGWAGGKPTPLYGWVKVGYYSGDATLDGRYNGAPFAGSERSSGVSWGLGASYSFTRYVGLAFDLEGLAGVKDVPGFDSEHSSNVTVASLGLIVTFAQSGSATRPPAADPLAEPRVAAPPPASAGMAPADTAEPAPPAASAPASAEPAAAPPATASAAAPAPEPAPAAVPAPATTVAAAPGQSRPVRAGTAIRPRPVRATPGAALKTDVTVRLLSRVENTDGAWWFVEHGGGRGWLLERDLGAPAGG